MICYLDKDYKCHATNQDGTFRKVEMPFCEGKCDMFIEGHRFIPSGESWTRADGVVFTGEMVSPWKPLSELDAAQAQYERQLLGAYEALIEELYEEVTG